MSDGSRSNGSGMANDPVLAVMTEIMKDVDDVPVYRGSAKDKVDAMKEIHASPGSPEEKARRCAKTHKSFMVACPMMFRKACHKEPLDLGALETLMSMAETRIGDDESASEFIGRLTAQRAKRSKR